MTIDEPVHLEAYNPLWPQYFERERQRIADALRLNISRVEHIGSTAVSGLCAKPIVDIMVGTGAFPPREQVAIRLSELGYQALGEAGVPGRLYFRRRDTISFNVHVVEWEGRHWKPNLALRDYLRAHPDEAARYGKAKVAAAQSGGTSLLQYSEAKSAVVSDLLSRALVWGNRSA